MISVGLSTGISVSSAASSTKASSVTTLSTGAAVRKNIHYINVSVTINDDNVFVLAGLNNKVINRMRKEASTEYILISKHTGRKRLPSKGVCYSPLSDQI